MFQVPFSDAIRNEAGLATMCVGNITTADQVNTILAAGRADLVALGRPHLANPNFTLQAAAQYGVDACSPAHRNTSRANSSCSAPRNRHGGSCRRCASKPNRK